VRSDLVPVRGFFHYLLLFLLRIVANSQRTLLCALDILHRSQRIAPPSGTAERTGMVEVPVGITDGTAGFLTVDAHYFKSGKVIVTLPLCNGIPVPQQNG